MFDKVACDSNRAQFPGCTPVIPCHEDLPNQFDYTYFERVPYPEADALSNKKGTRKQVPSVLPPFKA